jgi:hypothetical protein
LFSSVADVTPGQSVRIRVADGRIAAAVEDVEPISLPQDDNDQSDAEEPDA